MIVSSLLFVCGTCSYGVHACISSLFAYLCTSQYSSTSPQAKSPISLFSAYNGTYCDYHSEFDEVLLISKNMQNRSRYK